MATWSSEKGLPPGLQTLIVDGLVSKDRRRRIGDRMEIPFFVTDSKAKVSRRRSRREHLCASA